MLKNIYMNNFLARLSAVLAEDDFHLLPGKQQRAIKTAEKLGVDKLDDEEQAEVENEYYADDTED
jgi:hypothetical protein